MLITISLTLKLYVDYNLCMAKHRKHNKGGARPGSGRKKLADPSQKTVGISVSVTTSQKAQIKAAAQAEGISVSEYVQKHFLNKS